MLIAIKRGANDSDPAHNNALGGKGRASGPA
jgi:hypothetical protein